MPYLTVSYEMLAKLTYSTLVKYSLGRYLEKTKELSYRSNATLVVKQHFSPFLYMKWYMRGNFKRMEEWVMENDLTLGDNQYTTILASN